MGFVYQNPFLYRNTTIGYNVFDTISSKEGNDLMSLDYTDRLNKIAKKAGMLDFTKVKSWVKTAKSIKKSIVSIADYFMEKNLPIKLICGDAEPIGMILELCPSLSNVEIFPTENLKDRDLSHFKDCTILVVRNEIIDTLCLETDIYNKSPNCRVCSIYEYLEFNHINARYVFWQYYKFILHSKNIVDVIRPFFNHMVSYEKLNILLNRVIRKIRPNSNIAVYLPSYLHDETIFCANQLLKNGYLTEDELRNTI